MECLLSLSGGPQSKKDATHYTWKGLQHPTLVIEETTDGTAPIGTSCKFTLPEPVSPAAAAPVKIFAGGDIAPTENTLRPLMSLLEQCTSPADASRKHTTEHFRPVTPAFSGSHGYSFHDFPLIRIDPHSTSATANIIDNPSEFAVVGVADGEVYWSEVDPSVAASTEVTIGRDSASSHLAVVSSVRLGVASEAVVPPANQQVVMSRKHCSMRVMPVDVTFDALLVPVVTSGISSTAPQLLKATLRLRLGRFALKDFNTTNGTFLDGFKLAKGQELGVPLGAPLQLPGSFFVVPRLHPRHTLFLPSAAGAPFSPTRRLGATPTAAAPSHIWEPSVQPLIVATSPQETPFIVRSCGREEARPGGPFAVVQFGSGASFAPGCAIAPLTNIKVSVHVDLVLADPSVPSASASPARSPTAVAAPLPAFGTSWRSRNKAAGSKRARSPDAEPSNPSATARPGTPLELLSVVVPYQQSFSHNGLPVTHKDTAAIATAFTSRDGPARDENEDPFLALARQLSTSTLATQDGVPSASVAMVPPIANGAFLPTGGWQVSARRRDGGAERQGVSTTTDIDKEKEAAPPPPAAADEGPCKPAAGGSRKSHRQYSSNEDLVRSILSAGVMDGTLSGDLSRLNRQSLPPSPAPFSAAPLASRSHVTIDTPPTPSLAAPVPPHPSLDFGQEAQQSLNIQVAPHSFPSERELAAPVQPDCPSPTNAPLESHRSVGGEGMLLGTSTPIRESNNALLLAEPPLSTGSDQRPSSGARVSGTSSTRGSGFAPTLRVCETAVSESAHSPRGSTHDDPHDGCPPSEQLQNVTLKVAQLNAVPLPSSSTLAVVEEDRRATAASIKNALDTEEDVIAAPAADDATSEVTSVKHPPPPTICAVEEPSDDDMPVIVSARPFRRLATTDLQNVNTVQNVKEGAGTIVHKATAASARPPTGTAAESVVPAAPVPQTHVTEDGFRTVIKLDKEGRPIPRSPSPVPVVLDATAQMSKPPTEMPPDANPSAGAPSHVELPRAPRSSTQLPPSVPILLDTQAPLHGGGTSSAIAERNDDSFRDATVKLEGEDRCKDAAELLQEHALSQEESLYPKLPIQRGRHLLAEEENSVTVPPEIKPETTAVVDTKKKKPTKKERIEQATTERLKAFVDALRQERELEHEREVGPSSPTSSRGRKMAPRSTEDNLTQLSPDGQVDYGGVPDEFYKPPESPIANRKQAQLAKELHAQMRFAKRIRDAEEAVDAESDEDDDVAITSIMFRAKNICENGTTTRAHNHPDDNDAQPALPVDESQLRAGADLRMSEAVSSHDLITCPSQSEGALLGGQSTGDGGIVLNISPLGKVRRLSGHLSDAEQSNCTNTTNHGAAVEVSAPLSSLAFAGQTSGMLLDFFPTQLEKGAPKAPRRCVFSQTLERYSGDSQVLVPSSLAEETAAVTTTTAAAATMTHQHTHEEGPSNDVSPAPSQPSLPLPLSVQQRLHMQAGGDAAQPLSRAQMRARENKYRNMRALEEAMRFPTTILDPSAHSRKSLTTAAVNSVAGSASGKLSNNGDEEVGEMTWEERQLHEEEALVELARGIRLFKQDMDAEEAGECSPIPEDQVAQMTGLLHSLRVLNTPSANPHYSSYSRPSPASFGPAADAKRLLRDASGVYALHYAHAAVPQFAADEGEEFTSQTQSSQLEHVSNLVPLIKAPVSFIVHLRVHQIDALLFLWSRVVRGAGFDAGAFLPDAPRSDGDHLLITPHYHSFVLAALHSCGLLEGYKGYNRGWAARTASGSFGGRRVGALGQKRDRRTDSNCPSQRLQVVSPTAALVSAAASMKKKGAGNDQASDGAVLSVLASEYMSQPPLCGVDGAGVAQSRASLPDINPDAMELIGKAWMAAAARGIAAQFVRFGCYNQTVRGTCQVVPLSSAIAVEDSLPYAEWLDCLMSVDGGADRVFSAPDVVRAYPPSSALAHSMGLGKTLSSISFLLVLWEFADRRRSAIEGSLLSLVTDIINPCDEVERFSETAGRVQEGLREAAALENNLKTSSTTSSSSSPMPKRNRKTEDKPGTRSNGGKMQLEVLLSDLAKNIASVNEQAAAALASPSISPLLSDGPEAPPAFVGALPRLLSTLGALPPCILFAPTLTVTGRKREATLSFASVRVLLVVPKAVDFHWIQELTSWSEKLMEGTEKEGAPISLFYLTGDKGLKAASSGRDKHNPDADMGPSKEKRHTSLKKSPLLLENPFPEDKRCEMVCEWGNSQTRSILLITHTMLATLMATTTTTTKDAVPPKKGAARGASQKSNTHATTEGNADNFWFDEMMEAGGAANVSSTAVPPSHVNNDDSKAKRRIAKRVIRGAASQKAQDESQSQTPPSSETSTSSSDSNNENDDDNPFGKQRKTKVRTAQKKLTKTAKKGRETTKTKSKVGDDGTLSKTQREVTRRQFCREVIALRSNVVIVDEAHKMYQHQQYTPNAVMVGATPPDVRHAAAGGNGLAKALNTIDEIREQNLQRLAHSTATNTEGAARSLLFPSLFGSVELFQSLSKQHFSRAAEKDPPPSQSLDDENEYDFDCPSEPRGSQREATQFSISDHLQAFGLLTPPVLKIALTGTPLDIGIRRGLNQSGEETSHPTETYKRELHAVLPWLDRCLSTVFPVGSNQSPPPVSWKSFGLAKVPTRVEKCNLTFISPGDVNKTLALQKLVQIRSIRVMKDELPRLVQTTVVVKLSRVQYAMMKEAVFVEQNEGSDLIPPNRMLQLITRFLWIGNHCELVAHWARSKGVLVGEKREDGRSQLKLMPYLERRMKFKKRDSVEWAVPALCIPGPFGSVALQEETTPTGEEDQIRGVLESLHHSPKMFVLMRLLHEVLVQRRTPHPFEKVVVFSHSLKTLYIAGLLLQQCGGGDLIDGRDFAVMGGSLPSAARDEVTSKFNDPHNPLSVLLLSHKSFDTGTTFVGASRVVLYDPSHKPHDDLQAVFRCFRYGQRNGVVRVVQLVADTAVERSMAGLVHRAVCSGKTHRQGEGGNGEPLISSFVSGAELMKSVTVAPPNPYSVGPHSVIEEETQDCKNVTPLDEVWKSVVDPLLSRDGQLENDEILRNALLPQTIACHGIERKNFASEVVESGSCFPLIVSVTSKILV